MTPAILHSESLVSAASRIFLLSTYSARPFLEDAWQFTELRGNPLSPDRSDESTAGPSNHVAEMAAPLVMQYFLALGFFIEMCPWVLQ
jgi:hypothetical protein